MPRLAIPGETDLATLRPSLAAEWHPTRNHDCTPADVTIKSNRKVWWQCLAQQHEWFASIRHRTTCEDCPCCAGRRLLPGINDLKSLHPDLAGQWHPTLNEPKLPSEFTERSAYKAWWTCQNGHTYQASIRLRARHNAGCQYCSGRRVLAGFNDLATQCPEIAAEWNTEYNDRSPQEVTPGSTYLAWWSCNRNHSFQTRVETRTSKGGTGCPFCAGNRVISGETDLATLYPAIAAQWNQKRNTVNPCDVTSASNRKVWWRCANNHEWRATIANRTRGRAGCPFCGGHRVTPGANDLETVAPTLATQWHPSKNALSPAQVSARSSRRAWWICDNAHSWQATIANRAAGRGCPFCAGQQVQSGFNDLASQRPDIAAEWHPTRNSLRPSNVTSMSNRRIWWQCRQGHEWQTTPYSRSTGSRCPTCSGRRVVPGFNDLATTHATIAAEWHPTKNTIRPSNIYHTSPKHIWWSCTAYGHEWRASLRDRVRQNHGCPFCGGKRALPGFNDLATLHPDIASEWHPTLNDRAPTEVTAGSNYRAWWQCAAQKHEWETTVGNRRSGYGCPRCANHGSSRREEAICSQITNLLGIEYYGPQRLSCWPAPIDLILPGMKTVVEYDGWYWHRDKADVDQRKTQALQAAGWRVIRVRENRAGRVLPSITGTLVYCTDFEEPCSVAHRVVALIQGPENSNPQDAQRDGNQERMTTFDNRSGRGAS